MALSDTVNQLLSFAVDEQYFIDENLDLWKTLTGREKETAVRCGDDIRVGCVLAGQVDDLRNGRVPLEAIGKLRP